MEGGDLMGSGTVSGFPVPIRTDAADAPADFSAIAQSIGMRIDGVDGQDNSRLDDHGGRISALEARITTLEANTNADRANLNALQTSFNNIMAWTKLGTIRIETGTRVLTSDTNGSAVLTYRQPFKIAPRVLLTFGSTSGLAAANGTGWNTSSPPGPWTTDNPVSITPSNLRIGGVRAGAPFRVSYAALGEAVYIDRASNLGGPGFDIQ